MKKLIFLFSSIILLCSAFSPPQNTINRSAITFKIKNLGIYTNGTIGGLQANIHFNPADLPASSISASVDVNTLNTDNSDRDDHLKSADFFDQAHYPNIAVKSIAFRHRSGNNYTGQFNLTIKDKTKQVDIPFTYTDKGGAAVLNGTFKLNRLDFGIGSGSMVLSDEVIAAIDVEVSK